jgi:hypothetical protein
MEFLQLVHFDLFECVDEAAPDWMIRMKKINQLKFIFCQRKFTKQLFAGSFEEVFGLTLGK